ncbi:hypothetical protein A2V61_01475 [Candidatus Woesebacteria bacterium RBG_19FT_COMBO_47_8]|uniref:Serine aminopeptidase S33 domain-containing protein n=1 Tax=Candidatus Woesebacteria bacterium RBG_13_46_13 TaxID=1802479 RepID=A0A1F7X3Q6_9BACT|nr:MAG: hypothetical protein A2Y68_03310 [Candidatus Woesebacteria bacterium RBG_13_46_13]OGM17196.1 MAG: hypothetical protein A2V61_01475 [Candidatus Woesebacteria bacterium RBG_19FT_COMBO_47_8]HJX59641.1 alpha/beta hydrolase [Patescibacteria group bacterium]
MKNYLYLPIVILLSLVLGWYIHSFFEIRDTGLEKAAEKIIPRPLDKYSIENLSELSIKPVAIEKGETIKETPDYTSFLFYFSFDPTLSNKAAKKVSGQINIPKGQGPFPLVIMFRGYVDQKIYKTGTGTQRAAEYFASNGYITLAPDFLGYAESDPEAGNIFESRFQTYTTALVLLASLPSIKDWDSQNVFIWAHSNGGQIALTLLEITQRQIPTVLWAPVSKPFPYSILYYTDESEDRGKLIRHELADFERLYDPDLYAIDRYYDRINAPLELHQGTVDDAVPVEWSDSLSKSLKDLEKDIAYFKYPGADHNLNPAWNTVVARNLLFFNQDLTKAD